VNEIVEKLYSFYNGSAITGALVKSFLRENNTAVNDLVINKILDTYNRRLIEGRDGGRSGGDNEFNRDYVQARRELDAFISHISKNLATEDIIGLKKRINDLMEKTILWSKS